MISLRHLGARSVWATLTCVALMVLASAPAAFAQDEARLAEAQRLITEASAAHQRGRAADGVSAAERALEIREAELGSDDTQTLTASAWVGFLYLAMGRLAEAEPLYERALAGRERVLGPDHPDTLTLVANLAALYEAMARFEEAEPLHERALAGLERVLGPDHPETLSSVNNLAALYEATGRLDEAESLYARALAERERVLGPDHPDTLASVKNLADIYMETGRLVAAKPLSERALAGFERVLGPDHPNTLASMNSLGFLYWATGRRVAAEPLFVRALAGLERVLGPDHPQTLLSVNNLAALYKATDRFGEAVPLYVRALAGYERVLGLDHPETLSSVNNLAVLYAETGRLDEAEATQRRGIEAGVARARRGLGGDMASEDLAAVYGEFHLALTSGLGRDASPAARKAALLSAQLGRSSAAGAAVQSASARLRSGVPAVADALRALDAANVQIEALSARRTTAIVEQRAEDAAAIAAQIDAARAAADVALAQVPDEVRALLGTALLEAGELQGAGDASGLLAQGEALVAFVEANNLYRLDGVDLADAWFAVVVTPDVVAVEWLLVTPADVAALVARVRASITIRTDDDGRAGAPPPFDAWAARALHDGLIAPLAPHLAGVERLLVVPDGPLQSLPLELLIAGEADGAPQWLGARYEIAVLPAVASLKSLREDAGSARGAAPLLAFAHPVLQDGPDAWANPLGGGGRPVGGGAGASTLLASLSGSGSDQAGVASVCALTQAPATARIAEAMRVSLTAGPDAVIVGGDATEKRLRALNDAGALADARVVAFNTHGLTAAETAARGFAEPALALTPAGACGADAPDPNADPANDGFLTLSEIIDLELDADWVLLTACNTAAADGAAGAEPLSGLARGFFYAGARALLVSHWPAQVSQDPLTDGPTEILIRELFAPDNAALSKATALQAAQAAVRAAGYDHPAYWAPFSLVGDGR